MILKIIRTLLFPVFFIGASLLAEEDPSYIHIHYMDEITQSIVPVLEKEFNLECIGNGGSMARNIASISIPFTAERRGSIEEVRELQVRCTEKLLKVINENEKIRPYLAEYPFPPERVRVSIRFGSHCNFCSDGTVAFVCSGRGNLYYSKSDPITGRLLDLFEEPYADALKIVQASSLTDADLCTHKSKPYEKDLDLLLQSCAREAYRKCKVLCEDAGGEMSNGIKEFRFLFKKNKRLSVEAARKLEISLTTLMLDKINSNEALRPYFSTYPFPVDLVKVKIQFQKSDLEDFTDGSLCSVFQENGKIQYHIREAEKKNAPTAYYPILIKEESYDEALQILKPPKKQIR